MSDPPRCRLPFDYLAAVALAARHPQFAYMVEQQARRMRRILWRYRNRDAWGRR